MDSGQPQFCKQWEHASERLAAAVRLFLPRSTCPSAVTGTSLMHAELRYHLVFHQNRTARFGDSNDLPNVRRCCGAMMSRVNGAQHLPQSIVRVVATERF
jgi:hypothetical protein